MSEYVSSSHVRCPFCLSMELAWDCDGIYEVEDQREYAMRCGACRRDYGVIVVVDFTFHSPTSARTHEDKTDE